VESLIHEPPTDVTVDQRLRAVHALAAISGQYLKAIEQHDLAQRIEALEQLAASERSRTWADR
jgi:hypothetical protein